MNTIATKRSNLAELNHCARKRPGQRLCLMRNGEGVGELKIPEGGGG